MTDLELRQTGRAGVITLNRPAALNALSHEMCRKIDATLVTWAHDPAVDLVIIDAVGERAFCAGGDLADIYAAGRAGDPEPARAFWRDEYRMNARIAGYRKPVVVFMQGYVLGGGVGLACHASTRIVCDSTRIALPECSIGLVPDVGASRLLARAPKGLGRYLGLTGARMGPGDAIHAGFADQYLPASDWDAAKARMIATGEVALPICPPATAPLAAQQDRAAELFAPPDLAGIAAALMADPSEFASKALELIRANSPLAMACTLEILRRTDPGTDIRDALAREYRFTFRALTDSDFLEGIRAAIIDKDRAPRWRHGSLGAVDPVEVALLLAPLGADELNLDDMQGGTT